MAKIVSKTQTKTLSTAVTTTGVISDLTFNNLVVGKKYKLNATLYVTPTDTTVNGKTAIVDANNNGSIVETGVIRFDDLSEVRSQLKLSKEFTATGGSLTFDASNLTRTVISNASRFTYVQLSEANGGHPVTTTDFT